MFSQRRLLENPTVREETRKRFPSTRPAFEFWRFFAMTSFSRAIPALVLGTSLLASAVAAQTTTVIGQPSKPNTAEPTTTTPTTQPDQKQDPKKAQPAATAAVASTRSGKPLSTNEDPAMIGKRNINTG